MIEQATASKQVERLAQMFGYPRNEPRALKELHLALMSAKSVALADSVINGILSLATADSRCPMPGDLRRLVWDRQGDTSGGAKCEQCNGDGWITVYRLVTYKGRSLTIEKSEPLNLNFEEMIAFRKKLPENQEILSGSVPCSCLPPTHHALTGEHP